MAIKDSKKQVQKNNVDEEKTRVSKDADSDVTREDDIEELSLDGFILCDTADSSRDAVQTGVITVINSSAKGKIKRLELSEKLMEMFDNPDTMQIAISEDSIIIAPFISEDASMYKIRSGLKGSGRGIIYNSKLVLLITEHCGLDFSNGRSCRTYSNYSVKKINGQKAVVITVR